MTIVLTVGLSYPTPAIALPEVESDSDSEEPNIRLVGVVQAPTILPTEPPKTYKVVAMAQKPIKIATETPLPATKEVKVVSDTIPKTKTLSEPPVKPDSKALMDKIAIPEGDRAAVHEIISRESGWNHKIWNKQGSGAYGLCQSLPAGKMASAGADYLDNPETQMRWCDSYAKGRYGGWKNAAKFSRCVGACKHPVSGKIVHKDHAWW